MEAVKAQVELLEKNRPQQQRAIKTYEGILQAAAQLLLDVGVERISTNLIAEHAGITVPALYRYFPNKYAILYALGARLMDRQNQVFENWFNDYHAAGDLDHLLHNIEPLLRATLEVTQAEVGGLQILLALRAVSPLQDVRLESHRNMSSMFAELLVSEYDLPESSDLQLRTRIAIDMGYAGVEMALEDTQLNGDAVITMTAGMLRGFWVDYLDAVAEPEE